MRWPRGSPHPDPGSRHLGSRDPAEEHAAQVGHAEVDVSLFRRDDLLPPPPGHPDRGVERRIIGRGVFRTVADQPSVRQGVGRACEGRHHPGGVEILHRGDMVQGAGVLGFEGVGDGQDLLAGQDRVAPVDADLHEALVGGGGILREGGPDGPAGRVGGTEDHVEVAVGHVDHRAVSGAIGAIEEKRAPEQRVRHEVPVDLELHAVVPGGERGAIRVAQEALVVDVLRVGDKRGAGGQEEAGEEEGCDLHGCIGL